MNGSMPDVAASGMLIFVALGIFALLLIPTIFFLLTLQKALTRCSPANRAMSPGLVWLYLIPLFNLVWMFFLVINLAKSLGNEFAQRGINEGPNPGQSIGMAWAICSICSIIPFVGSLAAIASLVCWILYWVKISNYSSMIAEPAMPMQQQQAPQM